MFSGAADSLLRSNAGPVRDPSRTVKSEQPRPERKKNQTACAMTMEAVAAESNLREAFRQVERNRGAPGPDGHGTEDVRENLEKLLPEISAALLSGTYRPGDVRRVWIPKAGGGERGLGIPNVVDRLVQQSVLQVLQAHYDATFHDSSHGFRPKRSCHTAIAAAKKHIEDGNLWVVDLDLEKFFDTVKPPKADRQTAVADKG
jgi:RNA-directed DNA polymerase